MLFAGNNEKKSAKREKASHNVLFSQQMQALHSPGLNDLKLHQQFCNLLPGLSSLISHKQKRDIMKQS